MAETSDGTAGAVRTETLRFPSVDGRSTCVATLWLPGQGEPVRVLHVVHGMCEHIGRYDEFARMLCGRGWAVAGMDLVGHGRTEPDPARRGTYSDPHLAAEAMVEDQHTLRTMVQARLVRQPYLMLGHSMGSFVARCYAGRHGGGLAGLVVMGTAWQDGVPAMRAAVSALARVRGLDFRSRLVDSLGCGGYNRRFEGTGARTGFEWLSRDEARVVAYAADPACGFVFSLGGYLALADLLAEAQDPVRIARVPADLPVLVVSGSEDPVGQAGRGPARAFRALQRAGVRDVSLDLVRGARHELLNETCRGEVARNLVSWLESRSPLR